MNLEDYVQNGDIELYLLGALDQENMQTAEATVATYPAVKDELFRIEEALLRYAAAHARPLENSLEPRCSPCWRSVKLRL